MASVTISDLAIWIEHIDDPELQILLKELPEEEFINLEADGVVGRWMKMKTGRDGRPTDAIKPDGPMKTIWGEWYRTQRGDIIPLRAVRLADDDLTMVAPLFAEWESSEDEAAFRDLRTI